MRLLCEDIRIVSDSDAEHVESLRQYILSTIEKFDNVETSFPMPYLNKALYACVFLTDELFAAKKEISDLQARIAALEKPGKGKKT